MRLNFLISAMIAICITSISASAADFKMEMLENPFCSSRDIDRDGSARNDLGCTLLPRDSWFSSKGPTPSGMKVLEEKYAKNVVTHLTYHHAGTLICDEKKGFKCVKRSGVTKSMTPAKLRATLNGRDVKTTFRRRIDNVTADHLKESKGWGEVAYHFIVDTHGNVAAGRNLSFAPATGTYSYGEKIFDANKIRQQHDFSGHMTVMIVGNYDYQELSPNGRLALIRVLSAGQRTFRVETKNIHPHKHHANSTCPGKNILKYQDDFPTWVLTYSIQSELYQRGCMPRNSNLKRLLDGKTGRLTRSAFMALRESNPDAPAYSISDSTLFRLLDNNEQPTEKRWECK